MICVSSRRASRLRMKHCLVVGLGVPVKMDDVKLLDCCSMMSDWTNELRTWCHIENEQREDHEDGAEDAFPREQLEGMHLHIRHKQLLQHELRRTCTRMARLPSEDGGRVSSVIDEDCHRQQYLIRCRQHARATSAVADRLAETLVVRAAVNILTDASKSNIESLGGRLSTRLLTMCVLCDQPRQWANTLKGPICTTLSSFCRVLAYQLAEDGEADAQQHLGGVRLRHRVRAAGRRGPAHEQVRARHRREAEQVGQQPARKCIARPQAAGKGGITDCL